jgi:NAD-dependent deacetylase
VFSIGTSSLFPYIANPVIQASQCGIPTVEINPAATEVSPYVSAKFDCGAVAALNAIWSALLT